MCKNEMLKSSIVRRTAPYIHITFRKIGASNCCLLQPAGALLYENIHKYFTFYIYSCTLAFSLFHSSDVIRSFLRSRESAADTLTSRCLFSRLLVYSMDVHPFVCLYTYIYTFKNVGVSLCQSYTYIRVTPLLRTSTGARRPFDSFTFA